MTTVTIRDLDDHDVETVVSIAKHAWEPIFASFQNLLGDDIFRVVYPDWKADKEKQIRSGVEHGPPVYFIVADVEGKTVGFASFSLDLNRHIGEIGNNAVDPEYQNRGIASSLYAEVLKRMKSAGMNTAQVSTGLDDSHAPARSAYKTAGFTNSIPGTTYYQKL